MTRAAYLAGFALRCLVLGTLLFFALLKLFELATGATIFRYQGF